MTLSNHENFSPDDVDLEVILQRIFHEPDSAMQRTAIWDLLGRSDDWEVFEHITSQGGRKSIETYFHALLGNFDANVGEAEIVSDQQQEDVREMYAAPLVNLHNGDWAGSAAALHEILLNEIYWLFGINEEELPFSEATAFSLQNRVAEEILFPLSLLEYMAYSDYLVPDMDTGLVENNLALMLTLFFSAQAYLDLKERTGNDDLRIYPEE